MKPVSIRQSYVYCRRHGGGGVGDGGAGEHNTPIEFQLHLCEKLIKMFHFQHKMFSLKTITINNLLN